MPHLPPVVWAVLAVLVLLLLGMCAVTAYAVLRATTRQRIARWPAWRVATLLAISAVPWLVVRFAPIHLEVRVHGIIQTIAWTLVALLAFALLVLLPLAALLGVVVWCVGRRRRQREELRRVPM